MNVISSEYLIQEFLLPYNQQVRLEFPETKYAEFVRVAKLGLTKRPLTSRIFSVQTFLARDLRVAIAL